MRVYDEIQKIKDYELEQLIDKLKEYDGKFEFVNDYSMPAIAIYNRYGEADTAYIRFVEIDENEMSVTATADDGTQYTYFDFFVGSMTEILNAIIG